MINNVIFILFSVVFTTTNLNNVDLLNKLDIHQMDDYLKGKSFSFSKTDVLGSFTYTLIFNKDSNRGKFIYNSSSSNEKDDISYEMTANNQVRITWITGFAKGKSEVYKVDTNKNVIISSNGNIFKKN